MTIPVDVLIEEHWPYDGPHYPDTVHAAARAIAQLARYLANSTHLDKHTIPYAGNLYRLVGELSSTIRRLDQTFSQMATAATNLASHPTLGDDRDDRDPADTARAIAEALDTARVALAQVTLAPVTTALHQALNAAGHLGHNLDEDDDS